nr:MAG TPA: hypothetical protein [Caudoviricetes sp.]
MCCPFGWRSRKMTTYVTIKLTGMLARLYGFCTG